MEVHMDINELKEKFSELNLQNQLTLDEIPEIDLYMDQVTQFLIVSLMKLKEMKMIRH